MSKIVKKAGTFLGGTPSQSKPQLFGAGQLRTPEEKQAFGQITPLLTERAARGVDPRERRRLKTRAFEDIGLSTKKALGGLRETFGRTGVRGGVQGSDVADILEAAIGAKGRASTETEEIVKADAQQQLQNLLALLSRQAPFAVSQASRGPRQGLFGVAQQGGEALSAIKGAL